MTRRIRCTAVFVIALFGSCASVKPAPNENEIRALVELVNSGKVMEIPGMSTAPFVFDTETFRFDSDVEAMWKNLHDASFRLTGVSIVAIERTGPNASTVILDTDEGRWTVLLEGKTNGYPRICGLKGPAE